MCYVNIILCLHRLLCSNRLRCSCLTGPTGWGADIQKDVLDHPALGQIIQRGVLVNDCVATGLGLTAVDPCHLQCLHTPEGGPTLPPMVGETMAAVVVGTGLGAVYLTSQSHEPCQYNAHPSEGGMTEFQALDDQQWALRKFLMERDGHVTVEGIVSGPGLSNVHQFLTREAGESSYSSAAEVASAGLAANQDWESADEAAQLCSRSIDLWLAVLGAELRQSALRFLPSGGLMVAGGIPPKLQPRIGEKLKEFYLADPLMGDLIQSFPLFIVDYPDLGLLGARVRAQRLL